MFPLIPVCAWLVTFIGAGSLAWYYNLPASDRQKADALANELAYDLYGVAVDKLTEAQARQIQARIKSHFN